MDNNDSDQLVRRRSTTQNTEGEDAESNASFGSNDEDPILTATITFDVTVDPNGQVISTSEGQIIAESIQNPSDSRRGLSLSDQVNQQPESSSSVAAVGSNPHSQERVQTPTSPSGIQADSLASMDSRQPAVRRHKNHSGQEGEQQSDSDESTSTTTESLIERSKKYMGDEAGIIILKREDSVPKNYNINLDFDLNNPDESVTRSKQSSATNTINDDDEDSRVHHRRRLHDNDEDDEELDEEEEQDEEQGKGFNINFDFDFQKVPRNGENGEELDEDDEYDDLNEPKGFNINLDIDLNDPKQSGRNTGVDIDLMITSDGKVETTEHIEEENDGGILFFLSTRQSKRTYFTHRISSPLFF
jgi:hypothetical protein